MADAGILVAGNWDERIQAIRAETVASQLFGGWYEGTIRSNAPEQEGLWGVYEMPSVTDDGPRAANLGGSALAITNASDNKEAAWAYVNYTLGTNEGQVTMLREYGLVPSLLSALDDPYVEEGQPFWGDQPSGSIFSERSIASFPAVAHPSSAMHRASSRRSRPNTSTAVTKTLRPRSMMQPARSRWSPAFRSRNNLPKGQIGAWTFGPRANQGGGARPCAQRRERRTDF